MTFFLERIDSVPIASSSFDTQFSQWLWVLVDSMNEILPAIEGAFNLLNASNYTALEIANLFSSGSLTNGMVLYDTTNNVYVGMQSGGLVKFTTTLYP